MPAKGVAMRPLDRLSLRVNQLLLTVGGVFLLAMILLTCSNIVLRIVWVPVRGTFELMGFFGAVVTTFALGYTQIRKGHIAVDVLINTFSPRTRRWLNIVNSVLGLVFFSLVAWQMVLKAMTLSATGEVTETLRIAYYPFTYGVALGCGALALVFLTDLFNALLPPREEAQR
jgi:TRAP-type C4-dicarboxylate transport system permease small subunit